MSNIVIAPHYFSALSKLDADIAALNQQKIRVIFDLIGLRLAEQDLIAVLGWDLILVAVPDRSMVLQLNRLCAFVPNLKFVVDPTQPIFTLLQGARGRRVWRAR